MRWPTPPLTGCARPSMPPTRPAARRRRGAPSRRARVVASAPCGRMAPVPPASIWPSRRVRADAAPAPAAARRRPQVPAAARRYHSRMRALLLTLLAVSGLSFASAATSLPHGEVHSADLDRLIWTDGMVTVQLAARWTPVQDVNADRMLLTWTDLRLRQSSDAARKAPKKPRK